MSESAQTSSWLYVEAVACLILSLAIAFPSVYPSLPSAAVWVLGLDVLLAGIFGALTSWKRVHLLIVVSQVAVYMSMSPIHGFILLEVVVVAVALLVATGLGRSAGSDFADRLGIRAGGRQRKAAKVVLIGILGLGPFLLWGLWTAPARAMDEVWSQLELPPGVRILDEHRDVSRTASNSMSRSVDVLWESDESFCASMRAAMTDWIGEDLTYDADGCRAKGDVPGMAFNLRAGGGVVRRSRKRSTLYFSCSHGSSRCERSENQRPAKSHMRGPRHPRREHI